MYAYTGICIQIYICVNVFGHFYSYIYINKHIHSANKVERGGDRERERDNERLTEREAEGKGGEETQKHRKRVRESV